MLSMHTHLDTIRQIRGIQDKQKRFPRVLNITNLELLSPLKPSVPSNIHLLDGVSSNSSTRESTINISQSLTK